ncbi:MAG: metallophosphoesterase family protein [Chloroflexota bacterium]|nr:metallophosphoesterase family protein [Chloroflexota bacterium]
MRMAVFADIHGNLPAFEAALADIEGCGEFDQIWCLGDLALLGGQPHECVRRLQELRENLGDDKLRVIGGNTDRYLVTGERIKLAPPGDEAHFPAWRDNLLSMNSIYGWNAARLTWEDYDLLRQSLGQELRLKVEGYGQVIGFHAIPGHDEPTALRPDSPEEEAADALLDRAGRLALCGHTHLAMDRQIGAWRVINPGSVGLSFGVPGLAEWALLEWTKGELTVDLRRVSYDVEGTLRTWQTLGYPEIEWIRSRLTA